MKKIYLSLLIVSVAIFLSEAQEKSLSLNYINIGKGDRGNWNSGVGLQGKIPLKNRLLLLPDVGYVFENTKTTHYSKTNFSQISDSYLFANINLAYSLNPKGYFNIIPYIGAGYYLDFFKTRGYSEGYQSNDPSHGAPFNITEKYSTAKIMANAGILAEVYFSDNVFFTVGCKYMTDIHNWDSYVPYFNAGIGFSF
jgi:hypothetical protein